MNYHFILRPVFILALISSTALAQSPAGEVKTFASDGLSFNYPADWTLTDKSNAQAQHLILSQAKSSVLIMIVAYRDLISSREQFALALSNFTSPYLDSIARNFATPAHKAERDYPCMDINGVKISGTRLRGLYQNEQSTGEVYTLVRGRRFVNLVYIRADKDSAQAAIAWETALKTLKIDNPDTAVAADAFSDNIVSGGLLNGTAIKLPKPVYSDFARSARASGTVVVQVTIDEAGNVASAKALQGHPLLQKPSEEAALQAKFTPTRICDRPVKVTGTISYAFVQ
jgi:TonB family protein